ncbi:MAG: EAL domain-containing protein, partial [Lachnospiraceae bacterium]|nr:EAL domain-containing protein [Lachnospiraceae bacterium]
MGRYHYSEEEFRLIERSCLAFAVYQFLDSRVVTIALSAGFLDLFDLPDRAEAYHLMDNDMYRDAHPDDIARIADAAVRFATEGGEYDVLYRSKVRNEFRMIHARGKHTYTDTGVRLAVISYSDEGSYNEESEPGFTDSVQTEFRKRTSDLKGHYDPMTGLPGLNYFFELADAAHKSMRENGELPVALYFDFNGMKSFNLRYGFAEGDKLIIAMSRILTRYFTNENCCRIGGDRFAAFDRYEGVEDKLKGIIEECKRINDGKTLPVRVGIYKSRGQEIGIGVACDRAKMACDEYRDSSTSGFSYFSDEMLKESELQNYIIDHLDQAIAEGWIKAYYQPIIRAANGKVSDFEALARWIDPVMGFLSPGDFIPVLENARLIYKLDLYITEQILLYMKKMRKIGNYIVPCSINISRSDFETCDIVEELRKRVDEAGIGRDMLTVEITESVIGNDLEYIRKQVERFHELGFRVWMDDYGSGYSSPEILQTIPFDTIKLDMQFIRQYEKNKTSGIIISGLVKMALSLGIETVVEGVETIAQVEFLKEIGCTKLQGFHFCKPITYDDIVKRYEEGTQIGAENPDETEYYAAIGKVNLYDLSMAVNEDIELQNYFNTVPMAILELRDTEFSITRSNQSYRRYMAEHLMIPDVHLTAHFADFESGPGASLMRKTLQCAKDGRQVLTDEKTADGNISHLLIRRIAVNPVNRNTALIVIVLGMTDEKLADNLTYAHVAQALSADYIDMYYVNLDTEHYMEYLPDADTEDMAIEKRGKNFFSTARSDAEKRLYEEDRIMFTSAFTKENVVKGIEEHGAFTLTYRIYINGEPMYVHLKAIRIGTEGNRIIIG